MNKNAYEIRLEILQMANNAANMKFMEMLNIKREASFVTDKESGITKSTLKETDIDDILPDTKDIIKRAQELYTFVNNG